MGKLSVFLPNRPYNDEVIVGGIGQFKNGHEYEVEGLEEDIVLGDPSYEWPEGYEAEDESEKAPDRGEVEYDDPPVVLEDMGPADEVQEEDV
jgi:hypothetical protein